MKSVQTPIRTILSTAIMTVLCNQVNAGAFSLYTEGSAAAIGNYAAGIAAEGADAAIGWYNPAGLVLIKNQQAVIGGIGILPSTSLTGTSTFSTLFPPLIVPPYVESFDGLQAAENAIVPALHYAVPLNDRAVFGISFITPFGLSTNYEWTSPVRYAATLSKLTTINVSPELGGKITENLSIGLGVDLQYAHVKFNSMIGSPALYAAVGVPPTVIDSSSYNSGSSFGVGFHTGVLLNLNENHSRLGVNYQSGIVQQFDGRSQLTGRLANPDLNVLEPLDANSMRYTSNNLYSNDIHLPEIVTLSGYQDITRKIALLGSVVWTGWDVFKSINLTNIAVGVPTPTFTTLQTVTNNIAYENYKNTWRFAGGMNYHVNDQWMLRLGGGYDQTPTITAERDVRLPDCDRWALSIGGHYQPLPSLGIDAGYTYLFAAEDSLINKTIPIGATSTYNVTAVGKNHAQLIGLQAVWKMDQPFYATTK